MSDLCERFLHLAKEDPNSLPNVFAQDFDLIYHDSVHINLTPPPSQSTGLVSWLIPTYNTPAAWLIEAIESCTRQRLKSNIFTAWEIVCIDDGSTNEDTANALAELAVKIGPQLRIFKTENQGVAGALNFGWQHCRGDYVARLDADDIAHEDRLATQLGYFAQFPSIVILGGAVQTFSDSSKRHQGPYYRFPCHPALLKWNMVFSCSIAHPTVMFRKTAIRSEKPYPLEAAEDYWFWLQMVSENRPMANVADVCTYIRRHPSARTKVHIDAITQSSYEAVVHFLRSINLSCQLDDVPILWGKKLPDSAERCGPLSALLDALVEYALQPNDALEADGRQVAFGDYIRSWAQRLRGSWSVNCLASGDVAAGAAMIQNLLDHGECPKSLGALLRLQ